MHLEAAAAHITILYAVVFLVDLFARILDYSLGHCLLLVYNVLRIKIHVINFYAYFLQDFSFFFPTLSSPLLFLCAFSPNFRPPTTNIHDNVTFFSSSLPFARSLSLSRHEITFMHISAICIWVFVFILTISAIYNIILSGIPEFYNQARVAEGRTK